MKYKMILCYILLLAVIQTHSQSGLTPTQQTISNSLANYFKLDRENIHLHLNKTVYLTNEQIWFKGYVIEKKRKPTQNTSNVYVGLYDSNGQKITTQLYYTEGNLFEGRINLDKKLLSGRYFLQAYTNFMNNFSEDESSVYEITILNASEKDFAPQTSINYNTVAVAFFPESGIFLEGIPNTVGVKISDCNDQGISVQNAEILDAKGHTITTFSTDAFGYGKFVIYETKAENYKAVFTVNGKQKEQVLPMPATTGISFSVDNYIFPDKTVVKLRTNSKTINQVKNKPYTLVFQQDEATTFVDFSFKDATEQKLVVPSAELPEGINSIYLTNQNLQKIGERIIFNPYPMPRKMALTIASNRKDSIAIMGTSAIASGTLSISVLPAAAFAEMPAKTIHSDFLFDNYLSKPSKNTAYYLDDFSRKKHYELDNFLLSQQSKYNWNDLMGNAPTVKFTNDNGFTIKGTVNSELKNAKESLVNMTAVGLGIDAFAHLNDKKEFFFENVMVQDSTKIYFVAIDQKERKPKVKIYSQLINNIRVFNKPPTPISKICNGAPDQKPVENIPFPKVENSIILDSITVTAKKNKLTHQKRIGNVMAKGFKISEADASRYRDVIQFIGNNGFTVSSLGGKVSIINSHARLDVAARSGSLNRNRKNSNGWSSNTYSDTNTNMNGPAVFIDNVFVPNYDVLRDYTMAQIDEIYINRMVNDLNTYGSSGIIRIYTKTNPGFSNDKSNASESLFVKNGFQRFKPYQNPKYDSVADEGFLKLGTIYWKPIVATDENGSFHFSIPNMYQQSVRIIIEGLSPDGQMVSETQILDIP